MGQRTINANIRDGLFDAHGCANTLSTRYAHGGLCRECRGKVRPEIERVAWATQEVRYMDVRGRPCLEQMVEQLPRSQNREDGWAMHRSSA